MPLEVFYAMTGAFDVYIFFSPTGLELLGVYCVFSYRFSFLSASQMQGSPVDNSIRPSLGDTPTDLNILHLGEAIYLCLLLCI